MMIVFLDHEVGPGTATACACTSFLMATVLVIYLAFGHARWFVAKYVCVACVSSACGAIAGSKFALKLDPVKIHFFVGGVLSICALLAIVPTLMRQGGSGGSSSGFANNTTALA